MTSRAFRDRDSGADREAEPMAAASEAVDTADDDLQALAREFLKHTRDLVQSVSLTDGRFLYVNQAWQDTLGYTTSEATELQLLDIVAPADQAYCQQLWQQLQAGTISQEVALQVTLITKQGHPVVLQGTVQAACLTEVGESLKSRDARGNGEVT